MLALIATLAVTLANPVPAGVAKSAVAATKKKKKPAAKDQPAETSEGIDLTAPATPPPAQEQAPPPNDTPEPPPPAEEPPPAAAAGWSIVTPHTVGSGGNLLEAGIGFPGLEAAYWRGIIDALDVGARITLDYGYAGLLTSPQFGFGFQAQAKYLILTKDKISIGANFKPGLSFLFPPSRAARVGLLLPLEANAGYAFNEKFSFGATLTFPIFTIFGIGTVFPILLGVGAEYSITSSLMAWVQVKSGPAFWTNGSGINGYLDAKVGIGFHL
jgi:hypothetical protein